MNKIILLVSIVLLLSCKEKEKPQLKRKIDVVLDNIFQDKYSNYDTNDLTKEKALNELTRRSDSAFNASGMDDIPVKVYSISKNPSGPGAMVKLRTDNSNEDSRVLSNDVNFDLICMMPESNAEKLIDGNTYFVKSKKFLRLNKTQIDALTNQTFHYQEAMIENQDAIQGRTFNLGIYLCEPTSLDHIHKQ